MSRVDLEALASLLTALEAGDDSSPAAVWLGSEPGSPDALSEADALLAIEAAQRMGMGGHLLAAKGSAIKSVRKAAARSIHALTSSGGQIPDAPKQASGTAHAGATESPAAPTPAGAAAAAATAATVVATSIASNRQS